MPANPEGVGEYVQKANGALVIEMQNAIDEQHFESMRINRLNAFAINENIVVAEICKWYEWFFNDNTYLLVLNLPDMITPNRCICSDIGLKLSIFIEIQQFWKCSVELCWVVRIIFLRSLFECQGMAIFVNISDFLDTIE